MSQQANKRSITIFVAGALALGAVMIFNFGGAKMFERHEPFIMYFDGSVRSLERGAPVKFKGVPIGRVTDVRLLYNQKSGDKRVPVFVQLDTEVLERRLGVIKQLSDPVVLEAEIHAGLRAQLEVESYVTGQMYVDLNYFPKAPQAPVEMVAGKPVIPTMLSATSNMIVEGEAFIATLDKRDFTSYADVVDKAIFNLTVQTNRVPFGDINRRLDGVFGPPAQMLPDVHRQMDNVLTAIENFTNQTDAFNGQLLQQSSNLIGLSTQARSNIEHLNTTLEKMHADFQAGSPLRQQIDGTLGNISAMAKTVNNTASGMEIQPSLLHK